MKNKKPRRDWRKVVACVLAVALALTFLVSLLASSLLYGWAADVEVEGPWNSILVQERN